MALLFIIILFVVQICVMQLMMKMKIQIITGIQATIAVPENFIIPPAALALMTLARMQFYQRLAL